MSTPRRKRAAPLRLRYTIATLIVIGVAANVAVTWMSAWRFTPVGGGTAADGPTAGNARMVWRVSRWTSRTSDRVLSLRFMARYDPTVPSAAELTPEWTGLHTSTADGHSPETAIETFLIEGHGWPMRALASSVEGPRSVAPQPTWCIVLDDGPRWRTLPLRPLPSGFLVNTALYAALAGVPVLPFAIRRASRHRRGRCLACGYPLGGALRCSECGRAAR